MGRAVNLAFLSLLLLGFQEEPEAIRIIATESDRIAHDRLRHALDLTASEVAKSRSVLIGTLASNPALKKEATDRGLLKTIEGLPPESYLIRSYEDRVLCVGADRTGTLYAAGDLKNFHLQQLLRGDVIERTEIPKMKYRWFWNWDTRTNWDLASHDNVYQPALSKTDSIRPWRKHPDAFLTNMKLVVDFMSEHKLNGLILWGFLRDNHGGVKAAQELCRYANERGVRILPGVNADRFYGGIYHEGNHPYNLETRARAHVDLRTRDRDGKPVADTLCAEKPENRKWLADGIQWLYNTFDIGGVNLEFAEFEVCHTPECIAARREMPGGESAFFKDLARINPFLVEESKKAGSQSWISYATYAGFSKETPLHIKRTPESAICQWTLTGMLDDLVRAPVGSKMPWPDGLQPPGKHNIGYIHWNAYFTGQEKAFLSEPYREAIAKAYRHGFEGLTTYGEESPELPNIELNYLAFSEFTWNPELTVKTFLRDRVAPLYGGEEAATVAWSIANEIGDFRRGHRIANKNALLAKARAGGRIAASHGLERWSRLIRTIQSLPELERTPDKEGFYPLLTKTFHDGWKQAGPGGFRLEKGVATSHGGLGLWYYERRHFENFTLRLQFQQSKADANSGVYVRFPRVDGNPRLPIDEGHEIQIYDNKLEKGSTGSIYGFQAPFQSNLKPAGTWNEYEITCIGPRYYVRLNGQLVNAFVSPRSRKGMIGVQNYKGSVIQFRDIHIRELPSEAQSFHVLYEGDSSSWKFCGQGSFKDKEGSLITRGGRGVLWHPGEFEDFVLQLDWMPEMTSDEAGIFLRMKDPGTSDWAPTAKDRYGIEVSTGGKAVGGTWHRMQIRCVGKLVEVRLNGKVVQKITSADHLRGHIGLVNRGSDAKVSFRNIRLIQIQN